MAQGKQGTYTFWKFVICKHNNPTYIRWLVCRAQLNPRVKLISNNVLTFLSFFALRISLLREDRGYEEITSHCHKKGSLFFLYSPSFPGSSFLFLLLWKNGSRNNSSSRKRRGEERRRIKVVEERHFLFPLSLFHFFLPFFLPLYLLFFLSLALARASIQNY